MKNRWIALLVAILLLVASVATAEGAVLPRALPVLELEAFEKYSGFHYDEATGAWSLRSNEADAALERFASDASAYSNMAYFTMELSGDARTGLILPVLNVYYAGSKKPSATAVSFRLDDVRYDFTAHTTDVQLDDLTCQRTQILLDEDGLAMLRAMQSAAVVKVRLHGENQYNIEPEIKERYSNAKQQIESSSLLGIAPLLNAVDFTGYDLWDLNEAVWTAQTGVEPEMAATAIWQSETEAAIKLNQDFEMISRGDSSQAVVNLQKLLIAAGFMQDATSSTYGEATHNAVARAQRYYGLLVTGSVDRQLVDLLSGAAAPAAAAEESIAWMGTMLGDEAELALDRYWFAPVVRTAKSGAERSCLNGDNTMFVADGYIRSLAAEEMDLYWQLTGKLICDGKYEYPVTFVCERDDGTQFGATLLPLGEARLVAYAEIPAAATAGHSWTLEIQLGGAILSYTLG